VGVLYPLGAPAVDPTEEIPVSPTGIDEAALLENGEPPGGYLDSVTVGKLKEQIKGISGQSGLQVESDSDDQEVPIMEPQRPNSMAVSFLAEVADDAVLTVLATGGRYRPKDVRTAGRKHEWWLRRGFSAKALFRGSDIRLVNHGGVHAGSTQRENTDGLNLDIEVFSRPHGVSPDQHLLTVSLVNRTITSSQDEGSIFQARFTVRIESAQRNDYILPYPTPLITTHDEEEESIDLLYRGVATFAVGHGCAADWVLDASRTRAFEASAECLPTFECPNVTPDIVRADGSKVEVPMLDLAGLSGSNDYYAPLEDLVQLYDSWVGRLQERATLLAPEHQLAAKRHVRECERCSARIKRGIELLRSDEIALQAFKLANHALLLQQTRPSEVRQCTYNRDEQRLEFASRYDDPAQPTPPNGRGTWRPFQIAFILMSLPSVSDGESAERRTVELIWFPTGGGKTEAYLGLAAFSMFMRRLRDPDDAGVDVIMRYTLRLLTAQQFQRASRLICAMEFLRRERGDRLGLKEFSIGIWVGNAVTPTGRDEAVKLYKALSAGKKNEVNKFILDRCPWCGAEMGPKRWPGTKDHSPPKVLGYERSGDTVAFRCPDAACPFHGLPLPVYVTDEDIYQQRPSLVIGTVDKFARLAWTKEARALFGIDPEGAREISPPNLIIQDELHLIAGPLGSMVGFYEAVIEELCTDRRNSPKISPKIVASTATIRKYNEQIKALYARDDVVLFPPPGLDADDSFFSHFDRDAEGKLSRGRLYVGVHAPGLRSLQTAQVRSTAALFQAPAGFGSPEERDPWWTMMLFFNTIRELGTMLSLLQSHIRNYFIPIRARSGVAWSEVRWFRDREPMELTSRLPGAEVAGAIAQLEVRTTDPVKHPVDLCLATCMIEVGIDIERLSLMIVNGQPKSTSQYIQVTSRIGRKWRERPGLVVTLYNHLKPRDRSHFEKFRSYHERLYAQVEPTSVTPFSPPVLERALHALMAVYARQMHSNQLAESPYPFPEEAMSTLKSILIERVASADPQEKASLERAFTKRTNQWRRWERTRWSGGFKDNDVPLLREAGRYVPPGLAGLSWPTPQSMRNVDAECEVEITQLYIEEQGDDHV
jgi:hypothetical protein